MMVRQPRPRRVVSGRGTEALCGAPTWPYNEILRRRSLANGGVRRTPMAEQHAAQAWERARVGASVYAGASAWGGSGEGLMTADLAFLSCLVSHITGCRKCWAPWVDSPAGDRPVDYLVFVLQMTGLRDVLRAVRVEARTMGRSLPGAGGVDDEEGVG
jgi:hypothetical protein